MDSKGRISIPAPFRRVLDLGDSERGSGVNASVHVCYGDPTEPFLTCWTQAGLAEMDERIAAMPDGHTARIALEEYFFEYCETLVLDDNGRLILPKSLRDGKGLEGETVFAGRGGHFRVFNAEAPVASYSALAAATETLAPGASVLSLLPPKQPIQPT
ncbi:MAG: cell division/cell wall cluster transcriptional repressor MraZ [Pseudomonadota bacterium]